MNNNKKNFSYFIILCFSLHASESLVSRAAHLAGSFWKNSAKLFLLKSFNKNKRKLVALSIIALAAFVYKASSQRMPYIHMIDDSDFKILEQLFNCSLLDNQKLQEFECKQKVLIMIITDLFNQNSSYAQNIIEKNTLAIDSILDKKKRGAFIDLLKKHKGDTIIPFVALESIPLKNKDSQNTYLWIPDKRSFYGIGKNNTLYYCCDIEREDHENFKVVLYKCLPGGLLQKSKDLLLKFSYRHNRNEIQFSLKNSMNDSKVIFAKNDIPNVLPKNIELAKKLCSVIDFKKHVEDYITDTLNFYNAKTPESKIIVDAPFSNQKNVYEYKINFDDVGTLQSLFSSTDKPAVNSSDFTLQKNLTASLISHLFDQKNLYAKNIVETAMLPLNKILHPHYTFNVKQESPFGAYLKNHHAEELLPFVALESVKKNKNFDYRKKSYIMNQENLLFEIQKQQAFNDPRDFLLFSKANTHNSVGVQLYREFSILPLLKAKKEFFDFYYDFNDDIKKIVFYTGSNTADLGQEFFILTESKVSKDTIDRAQKLSQLADLKGYIEHYVANILKEDSIEMQNT